MTSIVLDACAIIAYLRDEPGASEVADVLLNPEYQCFAHSINLCEVLTSDHAEFEPLVRQQVCRVRFIR